MRIGEFAGSGDDQADPPDEPAPCGRDGIDTTRTGAEIQGGHSGHATLRYVCCPVRCDTRTNEASLDIQPWHIIVLLIIVLLLFGAKRLPEIGRSLGSSAREFKKGISGDESPTDRGPAAARRAQAARRQPPRRRAPLTFF